jgi:hypothetical protein
MDASQSTQPISFMNSYGIYLKDPTKSITAEIDKRLKGIQQETDVKLDEWAKPIFSHVGRNELVTRWNIKKQQLHLASFIPYPNKSIDQLQISDYAPMMISLEIGKMRLKSKHWQRKPTRW